MYLECIALEHPINNSLLIEIFQIRVRVFCVVKNKPAREKFEHSLYLNVCVYTIKQHIILCKLLTVLGYGHEYVQLTNKYVYRRTRSVLSFRDEIVVRGNMRRRVAGYK